MFFPECSNARNEAMYMQRVVGLLASLYKGCNCHHPIVSKKLYYSSCNEPSIKISDLARNTRILYDGLLQGDRACLARSITLVESTHPKKRTEARKLIGLANAHAKSIGLETKTFR